MRLFATVGLKDAWKPQVTGDVVQALAARSENDTCLC